MAVNLKATATLNIKPYETSLNKLAAQHGKLVRTSVQGSQEQVSAEKKLIDTRTKAGQEHAKNAKNISDTSRHASRSVHQIDRATASYGDTLKKVNRISAENIDAMSRMTQKQIALRTASNSLRDARKRLADVDSVARVREDPTLMSSQRALQRADAAYNKALTARRAEVAANQQAAAAEMDRVKAVRAGNAATVSQIAGMKAMSSEALKLSAAKDRLATAEARFARESAVSAGRATPGLAAARRELVASELQYRNLSAAQNAVTASQGRMISSGAGVASGLAAQRYLLQDLSRQMFMASVITAALPVAMVATAASWERSFVDVIRTADPAFAGIESKVSGLRDSLVGMAQSMPAAFGDIAEIATLANQMGIAANQTADFTRAVTMFSTTSGVSVDIAATAFGRLTSILGNNAVGFNEMSDSILKVGVNSVATEGEIINVVTQISSIAGQAGFSAKEMIGLSGALASVRVPPELSRGVITRVFGQISRATADGGNSLENFARIAGISSQEFSESWGTDRAGEVFQKFMTGLKDLGPAAESELRNLGITSVRDVPVLLRLSSAADSEGVVGGLLAQTMEDAHNGAGETQRQYTMVAETLVSKFKVLGNNILAFFDAVGQGSLGPVGDVVEGISTGIRNLTRSLGDSVFELGKFKVTVGDIVGTVAVILGAVSALSALGAIGAKVGSGLVAASHGLKLITGIGGGLRTTATGVAGVATSTGLLAGAARNVGGPLLTFGKNALGLAKNVSGVALALTVAAGAADWFISSYKNAGSDVGELAQQFADIKFEDGMIKDMRAFDRVFKSIEVSNFGTGGKNAWDSIFGTRAEILDGVAAYRTAFDEIEYIKKQQYAGIDKLGQGGIAMTQDSSLDTTAYYNRANAAIAKVGGSLDKLVEGGNAQHAISLLSEVGLSTRGIGRQLKDAPLLDDYVSNLLKINGLDVNTANKAQLIAGGMNDITNSLYGIDDSYKGVFTDLGLDADDAGEAVGKFITTINEAADGFVSLENAMGSAMSGDTFDGEAYMQSLRDGLADQKEWNTGLTELAKTGSAAFIQALAEQGPAGAEAIKFFAANPATFAEADAIWQEKSNNLVGGLVANIISAKHWAKSTLGDTISDSLLEALNDGQLEQVYVASRGVGEKASEELVNQFLNKEISFDQLILGLEKESTFEVDLKLVPIIADSESEAIKYALEKNLDVEIEPDIKIDAETTMAMLRSILDQPDLMPEISPEVSLSDAVYEFDSFRSWAESNEILAYITGNSEAAIATFGTLKAMIDGTVTQVQIDALPDPAQGKLWQVLTMADGSTGFVQIDGVTGKVDSKIITVVDEAGNTVAKMPIDGDTQKAIEAITSVKGEASNSPAEIRVTADPTNARNVIQGLTGNQGTAWINVETREVGSNRALLNQANGGIVSYFADGGVRENHTAQIAPAGSMRVWAEPETGGEAYIPLSATKRKRSVAILDDVARRFGYNLTNGANVSRYADGGQYNAQMFSRQQVASYSNRRASSRAGVEIGSVSFEAAGSPKNQFREFTRYLDRAARRVA